MDDGGRREYMAKQIHAANEDWKKNHGTPVPMWRIWIIVALMGGSAALAKYLAGLVA